MGYNFELDVSYSAILIATTELIYSGAPGKFLSTKLKNQSASFTPKGINFPVRPPKVACYDSDTEPIYYRSPREILSTKLIKLV